MKKEFILLSIFITSCAGLFAQNKVVLQSASARDTINRNIYGHFAEHLGKCIYGGFYVGG